MSLGPIAPGDNVGSSTAVDNDALASYIEQRWIPVLAYEPLFVDGLAAFRAQFEIDYTWGIAANAIQNNQGGGFNADQVNLQTKNLNIALYPTRNRRQLSILLGTQSVYDTLYDPTITSLFDLVQTGYKLTFLGTDATAASVYANTKWGRGRVAYVPIGAGQPNLAQEDPRFEFVNLWMFDYEYEVQPSTHVGVSYWNLEDNSEGQAFAFQGLVRSGPGSGGLIGLYRHATLPTQ